MRQPKSDSDSDLNGFKTFLTAKEVLSYAVRSGLTVADLQRFTIGFVLDYVETYFALRNNKNIHEDEEKYQKMKSVLPFVTERFENKEISTEQYSEFMNRYKELEDRYGIYD